MAKPAVGSELTGKWRSPLRGTLAGIPIVEVPDDAIWDGSNVIVRKGLLRPRPGLVKFAPTSLLNRVTGAINTVSLAEGAFQEDAFQNDAFQVGSGGPAQNILAATTRKLWVYFGGVWQDITGETPLTATEIQMARFTSIQIDNDIWVIHTNGADQPRKWRASDSVATLVTGQEGQTIPRWSDVTTIGDRVIGVVSPYLVRWGEETSIDDWPALNFRTLADTPDPIVAIRNLGTMGGVIYKTNSIYSVGFIGGSSASSYRFELRGLWEGPASPNAVVHADGVHYYCTVDGRVGRFDGLRHQWVSDGVWPLVDTEIDGQYTKRIFGVFNRRDREIYFYYPRKGDNGELKGVMVIIMPKTQEGIHDHISFVGKMERPVSAGTDARLDTNLVLVFGSEQFLSYQFRDDVGDDGREFSGHWQPGLAAASAFGHRVEGVETFVQRGVGYGDMELRVVYSDVLDTPGGHWSIERKQSLSDDPYKDLKGFDIRARFLGVRYNFTTPLFLRWQGTRLFSRPVERV